MTRSNWVRPDPLRETWVFLRLEKSGTVDSSSTGADDCAFYEVGVGNPEQLVETTAGKRDHIESEPVSELVRDVTAELGPYKYQDTILITPTSATIQFLRCKMVELSASTVSLRGFAHISLENQLKRHFGQELADWKLTTETLPTPRMTESDPPEVTGTGAIERLWECWAQIYRLLPREELEGTAL